MYAFRFVGPNTLRSLVCTALLLAGMPTSRAADEVAAKVDGEPITLRMLNSAIASNASPALAGKIRLFRLDRLATGLATRHFLERQKIEVSESVVDAELAKIKAIAPGAVCACCKPTEGLPPGNYFTDAEHRDIVRGLEGVKVYLDRCWSETVNSPEKTAKLIAENRADVERDSAKTAHIYFSTLKPLSSAPVDPEFRNKVLARAQAAWQRLVKGEDFEALARDLSEAKNSASKGGRLGLMGRDGYPLGVSAALAVFALKPGEYSQPVVTNWGYHIFRREALTDDDILAVLKQKFLVEQNEKLRPRILAEAKIERRLVDAAPANTAQGPGARRQSVD